MAICASASPTLPSPRFSWPPVSFFAAWPSARNAATTAADFSHFGPEIAPRYCPLCGFPWTLGCAPTTLKQGKGSPEAIPFPLAAGSSNRLLLAPKLRQIRVIPKRYYPAEPEKSVTCHRPPLGGGGGQGCLSAVETHSSRMSSATRHSSSFTMSGGARRIEFSPQPRISSPRSKARSTIRSRSAGAASRVS